VLTNLVCNAAKFTLHGGVDVRATKESESDTHVVLRFEVTDTGIGVPEEARACLFQPFSQVDASTTRKHGGTGLGLAICKQLVNLMAGQIGCDSVPHKGSTFWFTARFERPSPALSPHDVSLEIIQKPVNPPSSQLTEGVRRRMRVLIVEDNAFNQKVVLRQVREMGFGADAVANGLEALKALDIIPYDLVLMDCQMPEMDGYACAAEIRRLELSGRHMPIIAMTAHVMKTDRDKCLAVGMDDFLSKPVRVAHLESVLTRWLTAPVTTAAGETPILPAEPPDALSPSPPVDWEVFKELAGNDVPRLRELSERYLQQTTEQFAKLRDAIATGAATDIKRIAHSAAGSSAMCGMNPIVALLRELERMGQMGQLADAPRVYTEVKDELARIARFLSDHIETAG
jgi:CheY-like chemotaxis protein/HPt (histidine-containing phosphotransfer) domain-containing protein